MSLKDTVKVNLGQEPFMFDVGGFISHKRAGKLETMEGIRLNCPSDETVV